MLAEGEPSDLPYTEVCILGEWVYVPQFIL